MPPIMRQPGQRAGIANPKLVSLTSLLRPVLGLAGASPAPDRRHGRRHDWRHDRRHGRSPIMSDACLRN